MAEKLIEKLGETAGRRGFMKTLSAASAALALSMFKVQTSKASVVCAPGLFTVGCCCLFKDPRGCTYSDCACEWSWACMDSAAAIAPHPASGIHGRWVFPEKCKRYSCKECYRNPDTGSGCVGDVKCSKATYSTVPC